MLTRSDWRLAGAGSPTVCRVVLLVPSDVVQHRLLWKDERTGGGMVTPPLEGVLSSGLGHDNRFQVPRPAVHLDRSILCSRLVS